MIEKHWVSGILTADPVLRHTTSGHTVCTFSVGESDRKQDETGNWVSVRTMYWNISAWNSDRAPLGDMCMDFLKKGDRVAVFGKPTMSQDRQGVWRNDFVAERVMADVARLGSGGGVATAVPIDDEPPF